MHQPIAFIRKGPVPIANTKVAQVLHDSFPDHELDIIDIVDLLRGRKDILVKNLYALAREYGPAVLLSRARLRDYFWGTPYLFREIKALLACRITPSDYVFSFQMQSLFDASVEGLPHFVYTDHTLLANLNYQYSKKKMFSGFWVELEKTIYRNATLVFTRSTNISRSLIEQYACGPDKVVCVYAGCNAQLNSGWLNANRYGRKNVLFVGIDWERKGGPLLVEAFRSVLKVHPDARLTIVGCSPKVNVPNCEVVGRLPLPEVGRYYGQASVFCMPTRLEPFGIALLEAFAHHLPVVATGIGAIPDFVTHGRNGYLVEQDDVEQLAQALIDLLGDPSKCRAFGDEGYATVMERYTWEKVGARLRQHINQALAEPIPMPG